MQKLQRTLNKTEYNKYSVALELQADYYAGVWTKHMEGETLNGKPVLEKGDVQEAQNCAASIGDDTIQKKFQGYVQSDTFTHGTSADRKKWFDLGYQYGDIYHGKTFTTMGLKNPLPGTSYE
jgi:predicted metalloprotease